MDIDFRFTIKWQQITFTFSCTNWNVNVDILVVYIKFQEFSFVYHGARRIISRIFNSWCVCLRTRVSRVCVCQFHLPTNSDIAFNRVFSRKTIANFKYQSCGIPNFNHVGFSEIKFMNVMKILFILSFFILNFTYTIFRGYFERFGIYLIQNMPKIPGKCSALLNLFDEDFIRFICLAYVCHLLDLTSFQHSKPSSEAKKKKKEVSAPRGHDNWHP